MSRLFLVFLFFSRWSRGPWCSEARKQEWSPGSEVNGCTAE